MRGVRSLLQAFSTRRDTVWSWLQTISARTAAALGRFPSTTAAAPAPSAQCPACDDFSHLAGLQEGDAQNPSAQCQASEEPDGSAPPSLEWRGSGVGSSIDWLPGADWALDDRGLRKWQQGDPAVFPVSDAEPPRGLLETDAGPDHDGDSACSGGLCDENSPLTLDGYNDAVRNSVGPQGGETTTVDSREQDNDCPGEVPTSTIRSAKANSKNSKETS